MLFAKIIDRQSVHNQNGKIVQGVGDCIQRTSRSWVKLRILQQKIKIYVVEANRKDILLCHWQFDNKRCFFFLLPTLHHPYRARHPPVLVMYNPSPCCFRPASVERKGRQILKYRFISRSVAPMPSLRIVGKPFCANLYRF